MEDVLLLLEGMFVTSLLITIISGMYTADLVASNNLWVAIAVTSALAMITSGGLIAVLLFVATITSQV